MADYRELFDIKGNLRLSGQADIYAYLFFQTARFLKPGGRMGIVTSNAWLDVAYGYELQKFFLKKFKIIAILESRCEPWFEDVSVNTIVTILERCEDRKGREDHIVKFVKIKKPLRELIPWDMKLEAQSRWRGLDKLIAKIESAGSEHIQIKGVEVVNTLNGLKTYEDDNFRIRCIKQGELLEEVERTGKTVKWGKLIKAPTIYYDLLSNFKKGSIVVLKEVADVVGGIITGDNSFFYLSKDDVIKAGIEMSFLIPVAKSPKDITKISFRKNDLRFFLLCVDKEKKDLRGTKLLKYIEEAERRRVNQKPSFKNRGEMWYSITPKFASLLWADLRGDKHVCHLNEERAPFEHNFYGIEPKDKHTLEALTLLLNSSIVWLFIEVYGRTSLGEGAIRLVADDLVDLPIPSPDILGNKALNAFNFLLTRPIKPIFEEVKMPDRQKLDSLVLEALGLDPKKHLKPLYDGLCELVRERIELAKMRKKVKKSRPERDIEKVKQEVIQEFLPNGPKRFPEDFLDMSVKKDKMKEVTLPNEPLRLGNYFFGEQEVITDSGFVYKAESPVEAKYLIYAQRSGVTKVLVPIETMPLFKTVKNYEAYLRNLRAEMANTLLSRTLDQQMAERLLNQILEEKRLFEMQSG